LIDNLVVAYFLDHPVHCSRCNVIKLTVPEGCCVWNYTQQHGGDLQVKTGCSTMTTDSCKNGARVNFSDYVAHATTFIWMRTIAYYLYH